MRRILRAAAQAAAATAKAAANVLYSDTMKAKAAQGATEISNALYSQSNAYSPVTADKAGDRIDRAANQNQAQAQAPAQRIAPATQASAAHRAQFQAQAQAQSQGQGQAMGD